MSCVCVTSRPRGKRAARSALRAWKSSTRDPEAARVAADLVEREQPEVAVERGVLDALRRHRRRGLLEARDELVAAALVEQQRARSARRCPPRATAPRRRRRRARPRLDVGPVDRQRGERVRRAPRIVEQRAQPLDLARERRRRLLELAPRARPPRTAALAGQLGVQRGQRVLAGRVDEQRRDVVEELVADGARRPASRAAPRRGARIFSTQTCSAPRVAQPLAGSRRGRRGRRDGRRAARRRRRRARARGPCRGSRSKTSGSSTRTRGEVVDVEEAPVPAVARVEVEEPRAQRPRRPTSGSRRRSPMWLGTMSSTIPQARRPPARAAPSSPPSASETRVGSTTS